MIVAMTTKRNSDWPYARAGRGAAPKRSGVNLLRVHKGSG